MNERIPELMEYLQMDTDTFVLADPDVESVDPRLETLGYWTNEAFKYVRYYTCQPVHQRVPKKTPPLPQLPNGFGQIIPSGSRKKSKQNKKNGFGFDGTSKRNPKGQLQYNVISAPELLETEKQEGGQSRLSILRFPIGGGEPTYREGRRAKKIAGSTQPTLESVERPAQQSLKVPVNSELQFEFQDCARKCIVPTIQRGSNILGTVLSPSKDHHFNPLLLFIEDLFIFLMA